MKFSALSFNAFTAVPFSFFFSFPSWTSVMGGRFSMADKKKKKKKSVAGNGDVHGCQ